MIKQLIKRNEIKMVEFKKGVKEFIPKEKEMFLQPDMYVKLNRKPSEYWLDRFEAHYDIDKFENEEEINDAIDWENHCCLQMILELT